MDLGTLTSTAANLLIDTLKKAAKAYKERSPPGYTRRGQQKLTAGLADLQSVADTLDTEEISTLLSQITDLRQKLTELSQIIPSNLQEYRKRWKDLREAYHEAAALRKYIASKTEIQRDNDRIESILAKAESRQRQQANIEAEQTNDAQQQAEVENTSIARLQSVSSNNFSQTGWQAFGETRATGSVHYQQQFPSNASQQPSIISYGHSSPAMVPPAQAQGQRLTRRTDAESVAPQGSGHTITAEHSSARPYSASAMNQYPEHDRTDGQRYRDRHPGSDVWRPPSTDDEPTNLNYLTPSRGQARGYTDNATAQQARLQASEHLLHAPTVMSTRRPSLEHSSAQDQQRRAGRFYPQDPLVATTTAPSYRQNNNTSTSRNPTPYGQQSGTSHGLATDYQYQGSSRTQYRGDPSRTHAASLSGSSQQNRGQTQYPATHTSTNYTSQTNMNQPHRTHHPQCTLSPCTCNEINWHNKHAERVNKRLDDEDSMYPNPSSSSVDTLGSMFSGMSFDSNPRY